MKPQHSKQRSLTDAALTRGGPAAAAGPDDWNQIYLMSAFMHPAEADGPGATHLAGFAAGIAWNALPLRPNTQGRSLAEVAWCMLTDVGADDLAGELGLIRAFTREAEDAPLPAPDSGAGLPWPDPPNAGIGMEDHLPDRLFDRNARRMKEPGMCSHCQRRFVA